MTEVLKELALEISALIGKNLKGVAETREKPVNSRFCSSLRYLGG
jgi:hypothetical protein